MTGPSEAVVTVAVAETQRSPSTGRLVGTWVALLVALACAVYDVLCGVVMHVFRIGFVALLPVVPAYLAGILLLVWVGRQGVPVLRGVAIGVGVLLALSLPLAVMGTFAVTHGRF